MEMHQLRYAVTVARLGNFSRAAEACHVSQPSLSQQILKLEGELGERLFDRTKRVAKPTPYGEIFLRRAATILAEAEIAKREAVEAQNLLRGTVNIGVLPTIAPYLLPMVLTRFIRQYPGVEVVVHEDTTGQLLKSIHAYEIDFALVSLPLDDPQLETWKLFNEELLLALPPGHPLAHKRVVSFRQLHDERLIVLKAGHCLGDQILGFCEQGTVKPRISFRSAQLDTILALVHSGLGISLVPKMAVDTWRGGKVEYRSLQAPRPERTILAAWAKRRPPGRAGQKFLETIEVCCPFLTRPSAH